MNIRNELGYTNPTSQAEQSPKKPSNTTKPTKATKPLVDPLKRLEIKRWAEERAYTRAKELGKVRSDSDYDKMREFDAFITQETLYWEKEAYLKIYNRENGK